MKRLRNVIFVITLILTVPAVATACFCGYRDTVEMKAGADKRNERLPNFTTSVCDRTWNMRGAHRDVDIIRLGLKNGFTEDLRREARQLDWIIEKENP